MTDRRLLALIVVLASGISTVGTSFGIYATSERFLVSSFNTILLEVLPGWFVSTIIQEFGSLALELSLIFSGVVLSVVLGSLAVVGYRLGSQYAPARGELAGFALATVLLYVVATLVVGVPTATLVPAVVGGLVVTLFRTYPTTEAGVDVERRAVVQSVSAVVAFNVLAHGLGLFRRDQTQRAERELQTRAERVQVDALLEDAEAGGLEAEGIKPLISDVDDFFKVDINPSPPSLDADDWSLSITGLVETERELEYDDILEVETVHQHKAIRCLSDDVDGDQLDTAIWTGCEMSDLLEKVEPTGEYAMLYGADDYFYSMPLADLEASVLAYGMNGLELPQAHGYPVRLLVPDRWGKLHIKWITEIEIIDSEEGGYWEERGWNGMGPVNAVTKIDRINRPGDLVQICGHAYAGARGVETVEVSLDGGESWEEATLSEPLPEPDTIRQWVYEFDPAEVSEDGPYDMYARTIDGDGETQTEAEAGPFPDGATGWGHRTVRPE